jgi:hypothetical protein
MFDAPLWRDYFVMVGGGAAALVGVESQARHTTH